MQEATTVMGTSQLEAFAASRRVAWNVWLQDGWNVARKTGNPQALTIMSILESHGIMAMPAATPDAGEAVRFLESPHDRLWFGIVILLKDEQMPSPAWVQTQHSSSIAAAYEPDIRTIVIQDTEPMSATWKGIVLLHEGNHAGATTFRPYDWKNHQEFCRAERDTHEFENDLLSTLGGHRYQQLLAAEVRRLHGTIGDRVGAAIASRTDYDRTLDTIFGPAESDMERALRQTHFWIHANFVLLDQYFHGDVEEQKAKLLFTIYSQAGMHWES